MDYELKAAIAVQQNQIERETARLVRFGVPLWIAISQAAKIVKHNNERNKPSK